MIRGQAACAGCLGRWRLAPEGDGGLLVALARRGATPAMAVPALGLPGRGLGGVVDRGSVHAAGFWGWGFRRLGLGGSGPPVAGPDAPAGGGRAAPLGQPARPGPPLGPNPMRQGGADTRRGAFSGVSVGASCSGRPDPLRGGSGARRGLVVVERHLSQMSGSGSLDGARAGSYPGGGPDRSSADRYGERAADADGTLLEAGTGAGGNPRPDERKAYASLSVEGPIGAGDEGFFVLGSHRALSGQKRGV